MIVLDAPAHPCIRACLTGGLAIGVPGEVRGYYEAWRKFGRLEWAALWQPAIELLENGYKVEKPPSEVIDRYEDVIRDDPNFRSENLCFSFQILYIPSLLR